VALALGRAATGDDWRCAVRVGAAKAAVPGTTALAAAVSAAAAASGQRV